MSMHDVLQRPVADIAGAVASGDVSARELVDASLERARASDALGAFLTLDEEGARRAADDIDRRRSKGETLGPLAGVPIGVKDALCTAGLATTAASRTLVSERDGEPRAGFRPPYDATVVARLRAADAVIVGKCNMDEFAMGSSNENSGFRTAHNPWDTTRTPGGSSGGSAVAVAAGLAPLALGSDTGGSIRQPASFTGVVGLKPTYGRVSRYGLIAFASSLDQVGPMARDVRSAARLFDVIAGPDPADATSLRSIPAKTELTIGSGVKGLRVGIPEEYFGEGLDDDIQESVRGALDDLERRGATLVSIKLPHTGLAVACYYVLATAEASSNLARYDGVRYGLRVEPGAGDGGGSGLARMYDATREAGFGREVKRRILLGTYVLSAGYYDAYYLRAQRVRTLIRQDFDRAFEEVDVVAGPVTPTPAFRLGERIDDPLAMYLADVYTLPASLAGLPALSVPCGQTGSAKPLPIGLQLIGPAGEEQRLLNAAAAVEEAFPPPRPELS